ncbi:MAG: hypothetical protein DRR00_00995 [Candidatus Parabeggiatoa sp. nov. 3]|nr:MAG: hypothetical protein DRR00_00995 [Gammaproteobacteria bacterium]RKZ66817.1 MAG: hypothetical protein DRQ99_08475 [Gammaproteobacteria bacterium]
MQHLFLGTNYGHGSSVALINDLGELIFAVEEGRLINENNSNKFPIHSLQLACEKAGTSPVFWAEGWHTYRRLFYKGLFQSLKYGWQDRIYFTHRLLKELHRFYNGRYNYKEWLNTLQAQRVYLSGHHLAHAYSLLPWGLPPKSLIWVSDTTAEKESISSFYWSGRRMLPIFSSMYPHSIGSIYHQFAYHVGFPGQTGPGKLMALSSLGEPLWRKELESIGAVIDGRFYVNLKKYPAWKIKGGWFDFANQHSNNLFKNELLSSYQNYELGINLAASIQEWFTKTTIKAIYQVTHKVRKEFKLDVHHLGLAGGAALNCLANGNIIRNIGGLDIESVIVSPWSDDPGTAIGAAAWICHQKSPDIVFKPASVFLGPTACIQTKKSISENDINSAVIALINGKPIALVSGKLEFGPRALGGRCILANPQDNDIVKKLNTLKKRPSFMPFAPVVRDEDFAVYFNGKGSSNMAWTVSAKTHTLKYIPAATHVSRESRVQVLKKGEAILLYKILTEFKSKTNCGLLLLTSLNGNGEAIPASLTVAETTARRLGLAGLICDTGWKDFKDSAHIP